MVDMTKVVIKTNLDETKFMWLYAKYAYGCNPNKHCTNAILGRYSEKFGKNREGFQPNISIVMDEYKELNWDAIYICGVAKKGYSEHKNYEHNVHVAIIPKDDVSDDWTFENWKIHVENGKFENVISQEELEDKYKSFPDKYVTCRMFRWAVSHYKNKLTKLVQIKPKTA